MVLAQVQCEGGVWGGGGPGSINRSGVVVGSRSARRERTRSEQHAAHDLQDQREAEDELHATLVAQHAAEEASCAGAEHVEDQVEGARDPNEPLGLAVATGRLRAGKERAVRVGTERVVGALIGSAGAVSRVVRGYSRRVPC